MGNAVPTLVAGDEQVIRQLLDVSLDENGFEAVVAESGAEAVRLRDKRKDARGLVTDVGRGNRRKLTSWGVAHHACELNPGFAVVQEPS